MLEAVADRGYYSGEEILACHQAGITVTLPKPITSGIEARGRFGKQDFRYLGEDDVFVCPAGEKLSYHYTNEENGLVLRRYWTNTCQSCAIKRRCTTGKERRISRWEGGYERGLKFLTKIQRLGAQFLDPMWYFGLFSRLIWRSRRASVREIRCCI